jgi:RNA polymerase sigma-70 factor (ECF subfamily)
MDREQFKQQALKLFEHIYRIALGLSKDEDSAMDLVQDTYLKAWSAFEQFTPGTNMKAWLSRILYNTFVNEYKRREKIEFVNQNMFIAEQSDPAVEFIKNAMDEEIEKALNSLPDEYRSAIVLVDIGELSYEEAGNVLKCPVGTVRSRLKRARDMLRSKLSEYAEKRGLKQ